MDFTPDLIRQQLALITNSECFVASQRSRRLLEFLVEETLSGRGERLKGFYIASEFLGRGADFDPLVDPIVRIEMGKLRRALEHYYLASGEGAALRIEIPKGNYQPLFSPAAGPAAAQESARPAASGALLGRASLVIRCASVEASALAAEFSAGLTQQIAAVLDRLDDVHLLAADSEEACSARFLLQIGVRSSAERLRVSVRLEDRLSNLQIWADSFTAVSDDLFALEDRLAQGIANRIGDPNSGEMFRALGLSARESPCPSPEEIVARFHTDHMRRLGDPAWLKEARLTLQDLVVARPDFASARAALAKALHDSYLAGELGLSAMHEALEHARHAVRLEPENQHALAALCNACIALGDRDRAIQVIERSLALNSTGHSARLVAAAKLIMLGEAERAEALLAEAGEVPGGYAAMAVVAQALLAWLRGDPQLALARVSRDLLDTGFWGGLVRTVSLAETAEIAAARQSLATLLAENPVFARNPRRYIGATLSRRDWQEKIFSALHKAGLESGPP